MSELDVVACAMKIELTDREMHTLILAVEHAKTTVARGFPAGQTGLNQDAHYLRYASLEAKLKGMKPAESRASR
jgi:hypothetical protein